MKSPESKLQTRYVVALIAIAATVIASQIVVQLALQSSQTDGRRIGLAGRQRLLSSTIAMTALEIASPAGADGRTETAGSRWQLTKIRETVDQIRTGHQMLRFGEPGDGSTPPLEQPERQLINEIESYLDRLTHAALKLSDHAAPHAAGEIHAEIQIAHRALVPQIDILVDRMTSVANRRVERAKRVELVMLVITLTVLVLEALFVFRPTARTIRRTIADLRERERQLSDSDRRHRELIQFNGSPILSLEPNTGRVLDANPAATEALAVESNSLVGRRLQTFLAESSIDPFLDHLDEPVLNDDRQCTLEIATEDGSPLYWVARFATYQPFDGPAVVLLSANDTTEQVRREQRLVEANRRDGLTGLYNRREFDRRLRQVADIHSNGGVPFAVAMIDVDHFKSVNDRYGHQAGDEVLRKLARIIESCCRKADIVARYGGEEIVVIFPQLDGEAATAIAERIRGSLKATPICVPNGSDETLEIQVTVSIGLSAAPLHGDQSGRLIQVADAALYVAKEQGRDQVRFGSASPAHSDAATSIETVSTHLAS